MLFSWRGFLFFLENCRHWKRAWSSQCNWRCLFDSRRNWTCPFTACWDVTGSVRLISHALLPSEFLDICSVGKRFSRNFGFGGRVRLANAEHAGISVFSWWKKGFYVTGAVRNTGCLPAAVQGVAAAVAAAMAAAMAAVAAAVAAAAALRSSCIH